MLDATELKWHLEAGGRSRLVPPPSSVLISLPLSKHVAFLISSFSSECDPAWFDLLSRAIAFILMRLRRRTKLPLYPDLWCGWKGRTITPPSVPSPPRDTGIRKGEITQPHTRATTHTHMHCDSNLSASPLSKAAVATGVCCKLKTQQDGRFRSSTHHFSKRLLHFVVCRRFCDPRVVNHPNVSSLSAGVFFFFFFPLDFMTERLTDGTAPFLHQQQQLDERLTVTVCQSLHMSNTLTADCWSDQTWSITHCYSQGWVLSYCPV